MQDGLDARCRGAKEEDAGAPTLGAPGDADWALGLERNFKAGNQAREETGEQAVSVMSNSAGLSRSTTLLWHLRRVPLPPL